jgi:hypothetical protein
MGALGTCETGCREQRLELVPADACEALVQIAARARLRADGLRPVAERLAGPEPGPGDWEPAYRRVQERARAALRTHPPAEADAAELQEPASVATVWWCPNCGGIDAPQPCLAICVWRPVEWVSKPVYERARARALSEHEAEQRLRRLLRRLAAITPRPERWELGWRALQQQARSERIRVPMS